MHLNFNITVGAKTGRWGSLENECSKEFEIDLPDDFPTVIDFGSVASAAITAAIEEYRKKVAAKLAAAATEEPEKE